MRRRVVAITVIAAAIIFTWIVVRLDGDSRTPAARACAILRRVERDMRANAPAPRVLAGVDDAAALAEKAAARDPAWRPLAGGAAALRFALRHDDAQAARDGIDVVRAACASPTPHATPRESTPPR